jgi:glycosyltransferase involved in cell wall biosynthesis
MKIGLLHLAERSWGGQYQYSLSVIETLLKNDRQNKYMVINATSDISGLPEGTDTVSLPQDSKMFRQALNKLYLGLLGMSPIPVPLMVPFGLTRLGRWNKKQNVTSLALDLIICPVAPLNLHKLKVPYIMVIHDVMQRYETHEHPWKERVYRDTVYKRGADGSVLTVVFSQSGKIDLHRFYGIPLEKVRVIPCLPPPHIYEYRDLTTTQVELILNRFKLPERYIFYPAHFWLHKNHANLVKALHLIKQRHGVEIPAVFVGFGYEAFNDVVRLVAELGLGKQIFHLGYVSEKEIVALYKKAIAMVIPTILELNSLPVVEAFALSTCCLCSNSFLPEQTGDAALIFDPYDVEDMANKVWSVWTDESLRLSLANKGRQLAEEKYTPEIFTRQWLEAISDAAKICQKSS